MRNDADGGMWTVTHSFLRVLRVRDRGKTYKQGHLGRNKCCWSRQWSSERKFHSTYFHLALFPKSSGA